MIISAALLLVLPAIAEAQSRPANAAFGPLTKKQAKTATKEDKAARKKDLADQKAKLKKDVADAKAVVKRGKPYLAAQKKTEKAAVRALGKAILAADPSLKRLESAKAAHEKSPSAATLQSWQAAYIDYTPKQAAFNAALGVARDAKAQTEKLEGLRTTALSNLKDAQILKARGPNFQGIPQFSPNASLAGQPQPGGFMVVQQPSLTGIYGPAPQQLQRTNNYASGAGLGPADQRFVSAFTPGSQIPDVPRTSASSAAPGAAGNAAQPPQPRIQQNHFQLPPPPPGQ